GLSSLPPDLGTLGPLKKLWLDDSALTALDDDVLARMPALELLSVYRNQLAALPETLWMLEELQILNVAANRLHSLSEGIGRLRHLHTLDLGHNALTSLPDAI